MNLLLNDGVGNSYKLKILCNKFETNSHPFGYHTNSFGYENVSQMVFPYHCLKHQYLPECIFLFQSAHTKRKEPPIKYEEMLFSPVEKCTF